MILKKEIERKAIEHNVSRNSIDKDWVLGHFIDAVFSVDKCKKELIFKGGTCLRKCYITNYRFSEDLDFTAIDPGFVLDETLLTEIVKLVTKRTEMPLHIDRVTQLKHNDKPTGYSAIVKFWGADHSKDQAPPVAQRWTTSIKIEIIQYEKIIFPIVNRSVAHEYSDKLSPAVQEVPCYSLMEVLSEKLRALIQRSYTAPRDYYDIWYLANYFPDLDWETITKAFYEKIRFKSLEFKGIDQLINSEIDKRLQAAWVNSLGHQITQNDLPSYKEVKEDLTTLFERIFK